MFPLSSYTLSAVATVESQAPRDWTIQGSNDGSSWTIIDTQSGITLVDTPTSFTLSPVSASYRYFRINVTALNGGSGLSFGGFTMNTIGAPFSSGVNGDWYLASATGAFYQLVSGTWVLRYLGTTSGSVSTATSAALGIVQPDETTITISGTGIISATPSINQFAMAIPGSLAVDADATSHFLLPASRGMVASGVLADLKTAPTGTSLIVLVKASGTTIYTLTFAAGSTTATAIGSVSIAAGAIMSLAVTQVGSSVAGADLALTVYA